MSLLFTLATKPLSAVGCWYNHHLLLLRALCNQVLRTRKIVSLQSTRLFAATVSLSICGGSVGGGDCFPHLSQRGGRYCAIHRSLFGCLIVKMLKTYITLISDDGRGIAAANISLMIGGGHKKLRPYKLSSEMMLFSLNFSINVLVLSS
jgi:hypothetical protein